MNFKKMKKEELVKELERLYCCETTKITNAEIASIAFRNHLKKSRRKKQEHVMVAALDGQNNIIKIETIFIGTINSCSVHPREVFHFAIENSAASIIIAHNHPSNDLTASPQDLKMTERMIDGGELLQIKVLDHLIISDTNWFSFASNYPYLFKEV